ncbi:UNVERIFIED_CONTAM: hypothetical protein FO517_21085, partial [Bacillus subtilis]
AEERAPGSQVEGEEITSEAGARFALRWGIESEVPERVVQIAGRLQRLPRHLGIHSGGMVLCDRPVIEVCPV